MRARNLKPSLFKNEFLATSDPLHTVIFEGLWCLADREGRLEDRPRRIHLEINAGRAYEGTEAALAWLAEQGFVVRYAHGSDRYMQVVNFAKHQNPHMREPVSSIPAPGASTEQAPDITTNMNAHKPESSTRPAPVLNGAGPALSPFPLPESSFPFPEEEGAADAAARVKAMLDEDEQGFEDFKALYPKRNGNQPWVKARRAISARLAEGSAWNDILAGASRYAAWCKATGKLDTETVMQAVTFCGPEKGFLKPWNLPATKADTRLAGNLSAAEEFMRRTEALS